MKKMKKPRRFELRIESEIRRYGSRKKVKKELHKMPPCKRRKARLIECW